MYVVGVGLKKVYKALITLARGGAFSIPFLLYMSEAFFVPILTLIKILLHKSS